MRPGAHCAMSLARALRLSGQAAGHSLLRPQAAAESLQRRSMAGACLCCPLRSACRGPDASAAGGHHGEGVTYAGLTMHKPGRWHVIGGEAMAGLMWFWILYRGYHDWNTFAVRRLLPASRCLSLPRLTACCLAQFGHAAHFEHSLHEEEHGHSHGHGAKEGSSLPQILQPSTH